ncbi:MAG: cation:proton antiporter [Bacillota bacterium]
MEFYKILLPVGLIMLISKLLGIGLKRIGLPQVIGMLIAGVVVGLINYIPNQIILDDSVLEGISFIAKIGVVLIMFSAGIETDLKQIKSTGIASIAITVMGVVLPMGLGFVVAAAFNGGFSDMTQENVLHNLFYGVILTATSVSVTVATLKEIGKLNSKVGAAIVSAAIIDDIIGIIILSFVLGLSETSGGSFTDFASSPYMVIVKTFAFFVFALIIALAIRYVFKWMDKKWPHNRRLPIFSFAFCFIFAFVSEEVFGVADITGAFLAGLMLSNIHSREYIESKIDINCYMLFAPVFFASIGISTDFSAIDSSMLAFGLVLIATGMFAKLAGCAFGAKICGMSNRDSYRIGLGMMARAEVALVCAQKGVEAGIIESTIMPFILILIMLTSFLTPLLLRLSYKKELGHDMPPLGTTMGEMFNDPNIKSGQTEIR